MTTGEELGKSDVSVKLAVTFFILAEDAIVHDSGYEERRRSACVRGSSLRKPSFEIVCFGFSKASPRGHSLTTPDGDS